MRCHRLRSERQPRTTAAIKDIAGGREHCNGRKKRRGRYCIRSLGRNMLESYRDLTDEQLIEAGVAPDLIRLSVGIENANDIIADLEQAMNQI